MTRRIAIVVHCFAEAQQVYARLFTAQLSSVVLWPPKTCEVEFQVWTAETDQLTRRVCAAFKQHFSQHMAPASIRVRTLPKRELFRRAIGRNISALECEADVMWWADADYILFDGFLDALAAVDFAKVRPHEMIFPRRYWMQGSHEIGDAEIACIEPGNVFLPDRKPYFQKRLKLGIGGLQIVERDIARRGYCNGSKWCQPRTDETPFPDTDDDRIYRGTICSSIPVDLPGLYRIRHSCCSYEPASKRNVRMGKKKFATEG